MIKMHKLMHLGDTLLSHDIVGGATAVLVQLHYAVNFTPPITNLENHRKSNQYILHARTHSHLGDVILVRVDDSLLYGRIVNIVSVTYIMHNP